jgi:hypothetical protein
MDLTPIHLMMIGLIWDFLQKVEIKMKVLVVIKLKESNWIK